MGIPNFARICLVVALAFIVASCSTYAGRSRTAGSAAEDEFPEAPHITDPGHFRQEVLEYEGLVMVDFAAHWCSPCRATSPMVNRLASEMEGKLKVVKVYSDEGETNEETFRKYGISAIPTFKIFRGGSEIASSTGGWPDYNALKKWAEKNI